MFYVKSPALAVVLVFSLVHSFSMYNSTVTVKFYRLQRSAGNHVQTHKAEQCCGIVDGDHELHKQTNQNPRTANEDAEPLTDQELEERETLTNFKSLQVPAILYAYRKSFLEFSFSLSLSLTIAQRTMARACDY